MTRIRQKQREREYVERALKLLGVAWSIDSEGERPDFVVATGPGKFGLEVVEIFGTDPEGEGAAPGSAVKWKEGALEQRIDAMRREYALIDGVPLDVKILGDFRPEHKTQLLATLREANFGAREIGETLVLNEIVGLKVYAYRAFASRWIYLKNRVGWVGKATVAQIDKAIEAKASKLADYRANAGKDVRLLIVADRTLNSGKLTWSEQPPVDARGFDMVYFLSFPEEIAAINRR